MPETPEDARARRSKWTVRIFDSFEEADEADREEYRRMTPDERVHALLELVDAWTGASQQGFDRVCQFVEVPRG